MPASRWAIRAHSSTRLTVEFSVARLPRRKSNELEPSDLANSAERAVAALVEQEWLRRASSPVGLHFEEHEIVIAGEPRFRDRAIEPRRDAVEQRRAARR